MWCRNDSAGPTYRGLRGLGVGEPARRLSELVRREDAALLAVGAPSGDAASPDGVVAAALRDSQVPVMVVPGGTAVTRASQAA